MKLEPMPKRGNPATTALQIFPLRDKLFKASMKCFIGSRGVPKHKQHTTCHRSRMGSQYPP